MGERLEDFYVRLRREVAQMELDFLKKSGADEERIAAAERRLHEKQIISSGNSR